MAFAACSTLTASECGTLAALNLSCTGNAVRAITLFASQTGALCHAVDAVGNVVYHGVKAEDSPVADVRQDLLEHLASVLSNPDQMPIVTDHVAIALCRLDSISVAEALTRQNALPTLLQILQRSKEIDVASLVRCATLVHAMALRDSGTIVNAGIIQIALQLIQQVDQRSNSDDAIELLDILIDTLHEVSRCRS